MTTYLTAAELFPNRPTDWADWEARAWMHIGHVDEATVNRAIARPLGPAFDPLETEPGTIEHRWMRFAAHHPELQCDADFCDCGAAFDDNYLWWEITSRDADGALPITWFTTRRKR